MGELVKAANKSDLEEGKGLCVNVNDKPRALFLVNGQYYCIDDECSHAGGSLSEGTLDGTTVMCPLHAAEFDIATGKALSEPAESDVKSYKVVVEGDEIKVEM